jgi:hypothetical protein
LISNNNENQIIKNKNENGTSGIIKAKIPNNMKNIHKNNLKK